MGRGSQGSTRETQKQDAIQHLLILGHPDSGSFNHAVAKRYAETARSNYHTVEVRDLYAMGFDPVLQNIERPQLCPRIASPDVRHELDLIEQATVITFVYPLWFGTPPAIIKGYIDRVFGAVFMLSDLKGERKSGTFAGKSLSLFTSSASSGAWLDEMGVMSSLHQSFGQYLKSVFDFTSGHYFHADLIVDELSTGVADQRLLEVEQKARLVCAEAAAARHKAEM